MFIKKNNYDRLLRAYEIQKEELEWLRKAHAEECYHRWNARHAHHKEQERQKASYNKRLDAIKNHVIQMEESLSKRMSEIGQLKNQLNKITKESQNSICNKIRCCDETEAESFALQVGIRANEEYEAYECYLCPINKRTNEYYWHITHKHKQKRGLNYG